MAHSFIGLCKPLGHDIESLSIREIQIMEEAMATHSSILAWRIPWTEEPGGPPGVAKSQTQLSNRHAHTSFRPNVWSLAHLIKDAWCRHWLISFYFPADFFIGAIFQNLYGFFFPVCFVLLWIALLWWTCASILSSQTFEPLWIFLISINSSSVLLPNDVLFLPP